MMMMMVVSSCMSFLHGSVEPNGFILPRAVPKTCGNTRIRLVLRQPMMDQSNIYMARSDHKHHINYLHHLASALHSETWIITYRPEGMSP